MANEEHLAILRKGVEAWNAWREENPLMKPDLSNAYLPKSYLPNANLSYANLYCTDLSYADLSYAYLPNANLSYADLSNANLSNAYLFNSNLSSARLSYADLSYANLEGARLENLSAQRLSARSASLDRAYIGQPISALARVLFQQPLVWKVCFAGDWIDFDPLHDHSDSSYWLTRTSKETIFDAIARRLAEADPNSIHLTFQRSVWRDLVVIETGLRELFGEKIKTEKESGALTVSFQSTEEMQRGLDAVFIQLAAKHSQDGKSIDSMAIQGEGEDRLALSNEDLLRGFDILYRKMESIDNKLPAPKPELTDNQETLARMSESIPFFSWFSHRFRNWLTKPEVKEAGEVPIRDLFKWSRDMFRLTGQAPALGDGVEDAEVLEDPEEGQFLGGRKTKGEEDE